MRGKISSKNYLELRNYKNTFKDYKLVIKGNRISNSEELLSDILKQLEDKFTDVGLAVPIIMNK